MPVCGCIDEAILGANIAIETDYPGQGIGTTILGALFQKVATAGLLIVSLSVTPDNPALHPYNTPGLWKVKLGHHSRGSK
jgi:ribosomal protein S18 acetylase RimI-like enzyme